MKTYLDLLRATDLNDSEVRNSTLPEIASTTCINISDMKITATDLFIITLS